jgi:hypothetical protein
MPRVFKLNLRMRIAAKRRRKKSWNVEIKKRPASITAVSPAGPSRRADEALGVMLRAPFRPGAGKIDITRVLRVKLADQQSWDYRCGPKASRCPNSHFNQVAIIRLHLPLQLTDGEEA